MISIFLVKEEIIRAASLYKSALKENQAELIISLEQCRICYVHDMPHSHRHAWYEENLFLFYHPSDPKEIGDYLRAADLPSGDKRGLYVVTLDNDNIDHYLTEMVCDNLQLSYSRSMIPKYIEIDPDIFIRVSKLLAFV